MNIWRMSLTNQLKKMMIKSAYQPKIMGIVNVTPNSFSDGGQFLETEKAIAHGLQLIAEGADIVDIGGESTRPGAAEVAVGEELSRVLPVIEGLRKETDIPISIDSRHAAVMTDAVKAGATMINDVAALREADALEVASAAQVPVCVMHMQGEPGTMQANPQYDDVIEEVYAFLEERIAAIETSGLSRENIYVDVGIGFGKTLEHNLTLLTNLERFNTHGARTLLGTSRKRFIEKIMGVEVPTDQRLPGSLASLVAGLKAQVDIFRVHDVAATKQFIHVYQAINERV